ncbi:alpha/beta fold hydrolase [Arthrobacter sp. CAN_C5]|uniref:alpha/beta fold hydrolase n=1 Tax=Arthrobacter sp. CAN_C5 TaxID=2760706 RepID=UPI001AE6A287|nr:alpha/beta fold hydrolase [Arthrobacter sp. CAN_C5]MBP2216363.1 acyl-coenzyme A synthetase/AMP-(fatty) acid ligase/pimeloyl-ACP methyl ester carboxylesterase [Arthrobacter sp. CAN_C5]
MVALPGVDPSWPHYRDVPSHAAVDPEGTTNSWHYLDNGAQLTEPARGILLCVHGNPTWSYLWRSVLSAGVEHGWRVIAVDQLNMGLSERTGRFRRLADRVQDLNDFVGAMNLNGPIITVGHDWGGVVSLGFAHQRRDLVDAVVLTNTAIHQDPKRAIPAPLRLALHPLVHRWGTKDTSAFLDVTHALARPALPKEVRKAFLLPYRGGARRQGIADFVADIPAGPSHPSYPALRSIAEGIRTLNVPALMLWGPEDPIFSDTYLNDLAARLPQADIHRFEGASHLVGEDRNIAGPLFHWLDDALARTAVAPSPQRPGENAPAGDNPAENDPTNDDPTTAATASFTPLEHELTRRAQGPDADQLAVADMGEDGRIGRSLSWRGLEHDVSSLADALRRIGLHRGSRVSLMVPPGVELTVLLYACLRIGAVIIVADAGLGRKGLSKAVRGTVPDFLIGIDLALTAAKLFGWPGRRISVATLPTAKRKLLGVEYSLAELREGTTTAAPDDAGTPHPATGDTGTGDTGSAHVLDPDVLDPDADAAILFTSGSTGPAKGVVYTHRRLAAMRDTVSETFGIRPGDGLVAGFAPFALLGPALGTTSITPDMDVTRPRTLSASALADAVAAIDATTVFASPAALRNILATQEELTDAGRQALAGVLLLLSAGAPVPSRLLSELLGILPAASLHTPYGMTEALPVTDVDLGLILSAEADAAAGNVVGAGNGVCVGRAVAGARIAVSELSQAGTADGEPTTEAGVTGEILIDAPHVKDRYHRLWLTQSESSRTGGWHRTGDIGHFDGDGRLWVEGRLPHLITPAAGVLTPVGVEQALEAVDVVGLAAVVGVGPAGTQAVVAVVETIPATAKPGLAPASLASEARSAARAAGAELSAVLVVPALPTDIRHNAKIDRTAVARWAAGVLAGGKIGKL